MKTKIVETPTHYADGIKITLDSMPDGWLLTGHVPLLFKDIDTDGQRVFQVKSSEFILQHHPDKSYSYSVEEVDVTKCKSRVGRRPHDLANVLIEEKEKMGMEFCLMVPYIRLGRTRKYFIVFVKEK